MDLKHEDLTGDSIKAFYEVYNELQYGFLEKVYENAMVIELRLRGFKVIPQKKTEVYYKMNNVGEYYPGLLVNDLVIIELKAAESLVPEHESQLVIYLRATNIEVGLLMNFGKKPEFKRKVYDNSRKKIKSY